MEAVRSCKQQEYCQKLWHAAQRQLTQNGWHTEARPAEARPPEARPLEARPPEARPPEARPPG